MAHSDAPFLLRNAEVREHVLERPFTYDEELDMNVVVAGGTTKLAVSIPGLLGTETMTKTFEENSDVD